MDPRTIIGFQWDEHNRRKNQEKHGVEQGECEETFFNRPRLIAADPAHSQREKRYYLLGRTNKRRRLLLVFTVRDGLVRVISARDQSKKERKIYENEYAK